MFKKGSNPKNKLKKYGEKRDWNLQCAALRKDYYNWYFYFLLITPAETTACRI